MKKKIFIDGSEGTTGLLIRQLLKPYCHTRQVALIEVDNHRDRSERRRAFGEADLSVLCLPDDAARDAMALLDGSDTRVLDASSIHRTSPQWVYGLPEISTTRPSEIASARYVSNPGCYATGAIAILNPLVTSGAIDRDAQIVINGYSGYSGGGKKMIAEYEALSDRNRLAKNFTAYSLASQHKHVREIRYHSGLTRAPNFQPHVLNIARGMMVSATFNSANCNATLQQIKEVYQTAYSSVNSKVIPPSHEDDCNEGSIFRGLLEPMKPRKPVSTILLFMWRDGGMVQTIRFQCTRC